MAKVRRILFVCLGNICRSPMAEMVLKDLVRHAGIAGLEIASAGTSDEEEGNPMDRRARAKLAEHGIPADEGKRSRPLLREDYEAYDLFLGMEERNVRNMQRIFGGDPEGKIVRLLDLTGRPGDIADPWYTGDFERAYRDIREGCEALTVRLSEQGELPL